MQTRGRSALVVEQCPRDDADRASVPDRTATPLNVLVIEEVLGVHETEHRQRLTVHAHDRAAYHRHGHDAGLAGTSSLSRRITLQGRSSRRHEQALSQYLARAREHARRVRRGPPAAVHQDAAEKRVVPVRIDGVGQGGQSPGPGRDVGVEHDENVPGCFPETTVDRRRVSAVLGLANEPGLRHLTAHQVRTAVGRAVVHDQEFPPAAADLLAQGPQIRDYPGTAVVVDDDHAGTVRHQRILPDVTEFSRILSARAKSSHRM